MQFSEIYSKQVQFQKDIINKKGYNCLTSKEVANMVLPVDNVDLASYHIQALIAEIGEILQADKRWKNYRGDNLDLSNKYEEIADAIIFVMNIAIFSGLSADEFEKVVLDKIKENNRRISDV